MQSHLTGWRFLLRKSGLVLSCDPCHSVECYEQKTPARVIVDVLKQMLNLIPLRLINRHACETGICSKARSFSVLRHLSAMLFAQHSHAMGLNIVCDRLRLKSAVLARLQHAKPHFAAVGTSKCSSNCTAALVLR